MLQQLTSETGAQVWAISTMIFFMAVFAVAVLLLMGKRREEMDHCARLPLDDAPRAPVEDTDDQALPSNQG